MPTTKVLFVAPYPFGRVASQRFRFEQYWDTLPEAGIQADFRSFFDERTFGLLYKEGNTLRKVLGVCRGFALRLALVFTLPRYDLVFVHREATPIGPPWFEYLAAKLFGKKIIYDFDDAIWLPNTTAENRWAAKLKCHWKTWSICRWAATVLVGNDFLASEALRHNSEVHFFPTTLDLDKMPFVGGKTAALPNSRPVLGWTGTHSTLKYLYIVLPVLQKLSQLHPFEFLVIADKDPCLPLDGYRFQKWNKATEWEDLAQMDIGLMPLASTIWEEGKCGFKALQYMSMGIPSVVSPTMANNRIVEDGKNGYIASSEGEWLSAIGALLSDTHLRAAYSAAGRATVEGHFSKKAWKNRFQAFLLS